MGTDIIIFLVGLTAGFVGNFMSGTQSFIALSSLLALGIPAHLSISIHRFGGVGFMSGGFLRYLKGKHIKWEFIIPTIILSVLGTAIGTRLILEINEVFLEKMISILMLVFIPLTLLKKNIGVMEKTVTKTEKKLGYLFYFLLKIWSGIFPFGAGIFFAYNYMYFWGMTVLDMRGTSRIPGIVSASTATLVFIFSDVVDWNLGVLFMTANFIGSYIGAHYTIKTGNQVLQYLILLSAALIVVKALFF
jgi:uncharacterized membrane protein YfcA